MHLVHRDPKADQWVLQQTRRNCVQQLFVGLRVRREENTGGGDGRVGASWRLTGGGKQNLRRGHSGVGD